MANNLTGDFEAVLQVSLRQINGILATMHQSRVDPNTSPSFAHTASIHVGSPPPWLDAPARRFAEWVGAVGKYTGATQQSAVAARSSLLQKMPPGATQRFEEAWTTLDMDRIVVAPSGRAEGRADVQISNPTISVPAGSVSKVTVHAFVRAQFYPDPGASSLPAPIHGEVTALYGARPVVLPDGRRVLRVEITADNNQIQFHRAPGTITAAAEQEITGRVRHVMRTHFVPLDVTLPGDFALSEFASLGGGPTEAIVLPLQLSAAPAGGSVTSVTNHFLGSSEFAIAVSKEYIQQFFDALMGSIRASAANLQFSVRSAVLGTANYTFTVASLTMVWKAGAIEVSGSINLTTPAWWSPNGYISFTQNLGVVLDVPSQTVSVTALGDPEVSESWFIPHDSAVNRVKQARDAALPAASASINNNFAAARTKLASALTSFDKWSSATYNTLEVSPDGIVVRGAIGTRHRYNPIVHYEAIDGGAAFSAFHSWIPGGRIESFDWTWVEGASLIPWFNRTKHITLEHQFVCPKPADVTGVNRICLQIRGTRITAEGLAEEVIAGEVCTNNSHEPFLVLPSWWMKLHIADWLPDPPFDAVLYDIIASHVNVVAEPRGPDHLTANTIVHFTGSRMERPLEGLFQAMSQMRRREVSPRVVLVLPEGAFGARVREMEERLGSVPEGFRGQLLMAEDSARGWSSAFAVGDGPSTHVINGRGDFAWKHDGRLEPAALAQALDEFAVDAPPPRSVPLQLTVRAGAHAPDHVFTDVQGNQFSLRRLRGRTVILMFWQSWSAPCVRELRRLQDTTADQRGPFVLAINGGESQEVLADMRTRHGLSVALIHDPDQVVASAYGVRCWPTSVSINEEGIVDRVQFGLGHGHRKDAAGA